MAKPKSMKLRMLVTLHTLMKYSDANHRMNSVRLNEYLRPYKLDCSSRVLRDTVRILRQYGVDVQTKGKWDKQGVWIENRPLPDHELKRLIFAVTTNPHLSKTQATDILQSLKPFVTVYQEPLLQGLVEMEQNMEPDDTLYWVYLVIQEAIASKRRVRYTVEYVRYNHKIQTVEPHQEREILFTPKCVYQTQSNLFVLGYNHIGRRIDAVNLKDITSIRMTYKHRSPKAKEFSHQIESIVPQDVVSGVKKELLYEGPVTFRCRGQYVTELYHRFGPPDGPVVKDARSRTTYTVPQTQVTSETLFWLSQIPEHGIRIAGPEPLVAAVRAYYTMTANSLLNSNIPANRPKCKSTNDAIHANEMTP